MNKKITLACMLVLITLGFMGLSTQTKATATLSVGSQTVLDGSTVAVYIDSITASTAYGLFVNDVAAFNWTSSATETYRIIYITASDGGSGVCNIDLYSGATSLDTKDITITTVNTIIPQNMLIVIGIAILVLTVIAVVVKRIISNM